MLKVEVVPIDSVHPDPANARLHPQRNLDAIKGSLARFGQQKPIVVTEDGVIRAGNGLWQAAKELGWTEIAVARSGLKGSEATGFSIADNRTTELSEWDWESLSETLRSLQAEGVDLESLGWAPHELEPLLQAEWSPPAISDEPMAGGPAAGGQLWIEVTAAQREVFERAFHVLADLERAPDMGEGEALSKICERFLAGLGPPGGTEG